MLEMTFLFSWDFERLQYCNGVFVSEIDNFIQAVYIEYIILCGFICLYQNIAQFYIFKTVWFEHETVSTLGDIYDCLFIFIRDERININAYYRVT